MLPPDCDPLVSKIVFPSPDGDILMECKETFRLSSLPHLLSQAPSDCQDLTRDILSQAETTKKRSTWPKKGSKGPKGGTKSNPRISKDGDREMQRLKANIRRMLRGWGFNLPSRRKFSHAHVLLWANRVIEALQEQELQPTNLV